MKLMIRWNEEELLEIVRAVPLSVLKDNSKMQGWSKEKNYTKEELAVILSIIATSIPNYDVADLSDDRKEIWQDMTFGELYDYYERAQVHFIIINHCNHILHETMIEVYELLERENRLRFMAKKNSQKAQEVWDTYYDFRRRNTKEDAWFTLQDLLSIEYEAVSPKIEKVYESVRDYMIRLGWRDLLIKAKIEVVFLFAKITHHSFLAFFKEFEDACGADFSKCFASSDLSQMVKYFAMMSDCLGYKTTNDKFGLPDLIGFDSDANVRVKWAVEDLVKGLQDNDLMDDSALRAIELNPKTKEDYERQLAEDAKNRLDESVDKLSEKYKVKRSGETKEQSKK